MAARTIATKIDVPVRRRPPSRGLLDMNRSRGHVRSAFLVVHVHFSACGIRSVAPGKAWHRGRVPVPRRDSTCSGCAVAMGSMTRCSCRQQAVPPIRAPMAPHGALGARINHMPQCHRGYRSGTPRDFGVIWVSASPDPLSCLGPVDAPLRVDVVTWFLDGLGARHHPAAMERCVSGRAQFRDFGSRLDRPIVDGGAAPGLPVSHGAKPPWRRPGKGAPSRRARARVAMIASTQLRSGVNWPWIR